MANGHGGSRAGAGRKPRREKFAGEIDSAERRMAGHLEAVVGNLIALADGGLPIVEEKFEPAGLVLVDVLHVDDDGKATKGKRLAFPDHQPEDLVLVERKVSTTAPDFRALRDLADRVLGRPTQAVEVTGEDGAPMQQVVFYVPSNGRDEGPGDPAE